MPDSPESQELAPKAGESRPKKGVFERFKKPIIAATGVTLAAASALGIREAAKTSSDSEQPNIQPTPTERTVKPATEPTQVVEITPTPLKETQTPSPTEAPTPVPTTAETPQIQDSWTIQVDFAEPSHFRTLEQDQAILNSVMDKYPHLYDVQIILTSGESSATYVDPDPAKPVIVYAGRSTYDFERKLHNEFARVFNVDQPEIRTRMQNYYSEEELQQLEELNNAVVEKWRNYPDISRLFSPDKSANTTLGRFTSYPDAVFLQESILLQVPGQEWRYPLNQPIFESNINRAEIEALASEIPQGEISNYLNISQFLEGEGAKLENLKADPVHKLALELLEENKEHLNNWSWTSTQNLQLDSKYLKDYYSKIFPQYEEIVLLCALGNNDPRLSQVFSEVDLQAKRAQYEILKAEADKELFDTVDEAVMMGEQENLITQYHGILNSPKVR